MYPKNKYYFVLTNLRIVGVIMNICKLIIEIITQLYRHNINNIIYLHYQNIHINAYSRP